MEYVKFDMHCHTSEGSVDSAVKVKEFAAELKKKGFGGMLITDHDSYGGYRAYRDDPDKIKDFVVLRGIEYDTFEYGHFLVVLPEDAPESMFKLLEHRGLSLFNLIRLVHGCGGVLGPAHPCGEKFLSFLSTRKSFVTLYKWYIKFLDFLEGYNACEDEQDNYIARLIAHEHDLPVVGGSDAHNMDCIGMGYTLLPSCIKTDKDFIAFIKNGNKPKVGGHRYCMTTKDKLGTANLSLVYGFFMYNKWGAFCNITSRRKYKKQIRLDLMKKLRKDENTFEKTE